MIPSRLLPRLYFSSAFLLFDYQVNTHTNLFVFIVSFCYSQFGWSLVMTRLGFFLTSFLLFIFTAFRYASSSSNIVRRRNGSFSNENRDNRRIGSTSRLRREMSSLNGDRGRSRLRSQPENVEAITEISPRNGRPTRHSHTVAGGRHRTPPSYDSDYHYYGEFGDTFNRAIAESLFVDSSNGQPVNRSNFRSISGAGIEAPDMSSHPIYGTWMH